MKLYKTRYLCFLTILVNFSGVLNAQTPTFEVNFGLHLTSAASTHRQNAEVEVVDVTDPQGHGCCVTAPPSLIEIYLVEGELALNAAIAENAPSWFDFEPMVIDDNLEFIAESRATVAGFSNILSLLSGTVNEGSITAQVTIGADGGLPSGIPIIYDLSFKPPAGDKWAFAEPSITPTLGFELTLAPVFALLPRRLTPEQPLDLALSIAVGDRIGVPADWWLVFLSGDEVYSFDLETGKFELGFKPTFQGPLINVPEPVQLLNGFVAPGSFTIAWGIDTEANGEFDLSVFSGKAFVYTKSL